ncbi:hypothetical protein [Pedobacter sp. B4-66]|uniref:hypothetical protein n=1 Tax=Pedobacter sp. B4-66 TaxID=2817280 RepID=UPI001BD9CEB7|nr:hypothetical protein [Pedobacter sp. B4-66]
MDFEISRLYRSDGEDERLVLLANSDADIGEYAAMDSTYDEASDELTNIFRHIFWFPNQQVKRGEKVILYTKKHSGGKTYTYEPPKNGNVGKHFFYWGSDANVWNNDEDSVTLIKITGIQVKSYKDIQAKK